MLAAVFFIFGLIIGSFLNVLVLRHNTGRSLAGRSGCLVCGAQLAWYELVPILSWVLQKRTCTHCRVRIAWQYPLVELTTGMVFALLATTIPVTWLLFLAFSIAAVLIAIAAYDIKHTIIPDAWSYTFAVLALVWGVATVPSFDWWYLIAGPVVAAPLALMWLISKGRWMGLGDAKLMLGVGWLLGMTNGLIALMGAFVIGAGISVILLVGGAYVLHMVQRSGITGLVLQSPTFTIKSEIPFGPFLIGSCFLVWMLTLHNVDPLVLVASLSLNFSL